MAANLRFGEIVPELPVPVLNEREVRAGAGILFVIALVAFMNAWFAGDFRPTKLVVVGFLIDFLIRVVVDPRFSPSLILGRFAVRGQTPDYVGAPQKRFAWAIGLVLAAAMSWLVVIQDVRGPANLLICLTCLTLLFFESAFGICIGCRIHDLFARDKARLCPGDACETTERQPIQRLSRVQIAVPFVFLGGLWLVAPWVTSAAAPLGGHLTGGGAATVSPEEAARCRVPEFAKAIGHEEKWKLHNGCK